MTQKKVVILLTTGIFVLGVPQTTYAATLTRDSTLNYLDGTTTNTTTGSNTIDDVSSGVEDVSDFMGDIDSELSELEGYYNETLGEISDTIGQVMGLFNRVTSPIASIFQKADEMADIIVRLINFPSQIGGWWDKLVDSVVGELDPCLSELGSGRTPTFVYESGWCFGGGSEDDTGGSWGSEGSEEEIGGVINDGDSLPHDSGSMAPYKGKKSVGEVIKESQGDAGIPIPSQVRLKMQEAVENGGSNNSFEVNPTVVSLYAGNMADRGTTRLAAESTLGEVGQKKMVEESKGLQKAVISSFSTAKSAQKLDVTQDVMKQMVQMQATQNLLTGSVAASSQQNRIDNALANLNLTNMSRSLDESNRSRRIDRSLLATKVLQSTAQLTLE